MLQAFAQGLNMVQHCGVGDNETLYECKTVSAPAGREERREKGRNHKAMRALYAAWMM